MEVHLKIKQARESLNMSQLDFATAVGVSQKDVSMIESGKKKFIPNKYIEFLVQNNFDINTIFNSTLELKKLEIINVNDSPSVYQLRTDTVVNGDQKIPLYDIEAVAGLVPLFQDAKETEAIDHISIPRLPKCDGAIYVTGDSMYPLLKSGDIIIYKQIHDIQNDIFWGEMYLLSIDTEDEEYISVKYIQKSEKGDQYIKLVSQNKHHQDRDILRSRVKALALVKASVRINSMS